MSMALSAMGLVASGTIAEKGVLHSGGRLAFMVVCCLMYFSFCNFAFLFAFRCSCTPSFDCSTQAAPIQRRVLHPSST